MNPENMQDGIETGPTQIIVEPVGDVLGINPIRRNRFPPLIGMTLDKLIRDGYLTEGIYTLWASDSRTRNSNYANRWACVDQNNYPLQISRSNNREFIRIKIVKEHTHSKLTYKL